MRDIRGYDPQSLLTGAEVEQGFTYDNSERKFESVQVERAIKNSGLISELQLLAPRVPVTFMTDEKAVREYFFAQGVYQSKVRHDTARYKGD